MNTALRVAEGCSRRENAERDRAEAEKVDRSPTTSWACPPQLRAERTRARPFEPSTLGIEEPVLRLKSFRLCFNQWYVDDIHHQRIGPIFVGTLVLRDLFSRSGAHRPDPLTDSRPKKLLARQTSPDSFREFASNRTRFVTAMVLYSRSRQIRRRRQLPMTRVQYP